LYNVLIVDDEIHICKLLEKLIEWERLELNLAGTANDGVQALEKIFQDKPDIVITDIRMSGGSGIDLIRRVRENHLKTQFIIVSGYRQFDYAKDAMVYGAADYILKPVNKEELNGILERLILRIQEEQGHSRKLAREIRKNAVISKRQLVDRLLLGGSLSDQGLQEDYGIFFDRQRIRFMIVQIAAGYQDGRPETVGFIMNKLQSGMEREFGGEIAATIGSRTMACMLIYEIGDARNICSKAEGIWKYCRNMVSEYGNYSITIGMGKEAEDTSGLEAALQTAELALDIRLIEGGNRLIVCNEQLRSTKELQDFLTGPVRKEIYGCIEAFNEDGLIRLCREIMETIRQEGRACVGLLSEFTNGILKIMQRIYGSKDTGAEWRETAIDIGYMPDFERYRSAFFEKVREIMERRYWESQYKEEQPVRIAREYIRSHFTKPITLKEVASEAGLNPNYFSVLFKKSTGMNFSEYIIELRIEEGRKLLKATTLNISEIADMVGYKDAKYFSRLFTKGTGLKPKEYRKLYS